MIKSQEKVSFYSHLIGAVAAFFGTVYLLYIARTSLVKLVISGIYGLSVVLLFSASSLYHALNQNENGNFFWRKLDHIAIFFMIAGTYTPVCYV